LPHPDITLDEPLNFRGHIAGLDVLRGIAISVVVIFHGFTIPWQDLHGIMKVFSFIAHFGFTGVHLFFLLSGFLITGILLDSKDRGGYYRDFYIRRALRILPAYLLLLIVLKIWQPISWIYFLACLLYIANMPGLIGARIHEYPGLWSLAVEEQFYLIWPTFVKRFSHRNLLRVIGICLVLCPLLRAVLGSDGMDPRYKTWDAADYLLYGAAISIACAMGSFIGQISGKSSSFFF
jgi:peptidoglycan/LPS O-acetylase OafA/YrhL